MAAEWISAGSPSLIQSDFLMGEENGITESWLCVDCGTNTAPGLYCFPSGEKAGSTRAELDEAFKTADSVQQHIDENTELYTVRDVIWARAGMEPWGGCLCIGCLEKRLGRKLKPKHFLRGHELNTMPGSPRLMKRRK